MSEFAFTMGVPIRYRDLDPWDHVNNAVYATYLEEARAEYLDTVFETQMESRDFVLAHQELDFRAPITHDSDGIEVAVQAADIGTSSLTLAYEVRQSDGTVAATGETTQVHMDEDGTPAPLPEAWRTAIRAFEPGLVAE